MAKSYLILLCILITSFVVVIRLNSQTGHWVQLNPLVSPPPRAYHAMTSAGEGKVLLFGGSTPSNTYFNDTWLFDYEKNTWVELNPKVKPPGRADHSLCRLNDSLFLLFGGFNPDSINYLDDTWIFNINDTSWTGFSIINKPEARYGQGMVQMLNDKALLFGGWNSYEGEYDNDTWIYDYEEKEWSELKFDIWINPIPLRRGDVKINKIGNGRLFLYGGWKYGPLDDVWYFNIDSNDWHKIYSADSSPKKYRHAQCELNDNIILVFGGATETNHYIDETWLFNFNDSIWKKLELDIKPPGQAEGKLSKIYENKAILFGGTGWSFEDYGTWLFTLDAVDVHMEKEYQDQLVLFPNFLYGKINLQYYTPRAGKIYIDIIDIIGNIVKRVEDYQIAGWHEIEIPTATISSGIYIISLISCDQKIVGKIAITR